MLLLKTDDEKKYSQETPIAAKSTVLSIFVHLVKIIVHMIQSSYQINLLLDIALQQTFFLNVDIDFY